MTVTNTRQQFLCFHQQDSQSPQAWLGTQSLQRTGSLLFSIPRRLPIPLAAGRMEGRKRKETKERIRRGGDQKSPWA